MIRSTILLLSSVVCGTVFASIAVGSAPPPLSVSIYVVNNAVCGQAQGKMFASASGGAGGYIYVWSNGQSSGGTISAINGLVPGSYSVTVTDQDGTQAMASATITDQSAYDPIFPVVSPSYCAGEPYAWFPKELGEGILQPTEPMTFYDPFVVDQFEVFTAQPWCSPNAWVLELADVLSGSTVIHYSDAVGCLGEFTWVLGAPVQMPTISINGVLPSCSNGATGSAIVQVAGELNSNELLVWVRDDQGNTVGDACGYMAGGGSTFYQIISGLAPGNYWAALSADEFYLFNGQMSCSDSVMFTIPDLGPVCGSVIGTSWYDVNADCIQDLDEVGIPYSVLVVEPGNEFVLTGVDGTYGFSLLNGGYTLEQIDASLIPICPVNQPVPFTLNSDLSVIDLANGSSEPLDIAVFATDGIARPGFEYLIYATVRNLSPQASGPVTISATFDPQLNFLSAAPTSSTMVGNVLTWDLPALGSFGETSISIYTSVPVTTALGTTLSNSVSVSNTLAEGTLTNNTSLLATTVTGSFDPNDKTARTSAAQSSTQYFIDQDDWIDYTIRFQNTGTDTAFTVVITDTLGAELDMTTFQQGVASHPFVVSFKAGRVVEWRFPNILLPDSNVNEAASHGLVHFRIKPVQTLLPGTEISNIANIYFDFNDPIITDPSVLVAEFSTGVSEQVNGAQLLVMPNPTEGRLMVRRSGDDLHPGMLVVRGIDGRAMLEQRMLGSSAMLNMEALAAGVYMLEHVTDNGSRTTVRFVKQ